MTYREAKILMLCLILICVGQGIFIFQQQGTIQGLVDRADRAEDQNEKDRELFRDTIQIFAEALYDGFYEVTGENIEIPDGVINRFKYQKIKGDSE